MTRLEEVERQLAETRELLAELEQYATALLRVRAQMDVAELPPDMAAAVEELLTAGQVLLARSFRSRGEEPPSRLTVNRDPGTVNLVSPEKRETVSTKMLGKVPAWMRAARDAGLPSLGAVADALGVSTSFMSQVKSGKKAMPDPLAAKFEKLTGYPATRWRR